MYNLKALFCCILIYVSCGVPKLTINKKNFDSQSFKTNGFYYFREIVPKKNSYPIRYDFSNCIFYENGVILGPFGGLTLEYVTLDSMTKYLTKNKTTFSTSNVPYWWGLFEVKNNTIYIEHWRSEDMGYGINKLTYKILNDTTLLHVSTNNVVSSDTFHFYYMPIKPDSTNRFIK